MKNTIIALLAAIIIAGAIEYRVTSEYPVTVIKLEPRVVAAYNARMRRPEGLSRVTWTDKLIRKDVRDIVENYELGLNVVDVNEIAR